MSNLKITIPNPCSANWDKMKNLDQGRFCEQCKKEVIDFTNYSQSELEDFFKYPKGNVCGRINRSQISLDYGRREKYIFKNFSYKLFIASCVTLVASKGYANERLNTINTYQDDSKNRKLAVVLNEIDSIIIISGIVKDSSDGSPLPGVRISLKDELKFTTTDSEGKFSIEINSNVHKNVILEAKFLGYETAETSLKLTDAQFMEIKINPIVLGELTNVIVGGLIVKRSVTSRIGYFFRRLFKGRY